MKFTKTNFSLLTVCSFIVLAVGGCGKPTHPEPSGDEVTMNEPVVEIGSSTRKGPPDSPQSMPEILATLSEDPEYLNHAYVMRPERAAHKEKKLASETNQSARLSLLWDFAFTLLNMGESRRALIEFEKFQNALEEFSQSEFQKNEELIGLHLATCYLRIAEQQNCLENHSPESCLFPIRKGGIHAFEEGSSRALKILSSLLQSHPDNADAKWLYNVAAMTLGQYPDAVPPEWLIHASRFKSTVDIGHFPNIAMGTGLDVTGIAGGCIIEDFDNDYDLDVMVSSWGLQDPIRYFVNRSDGTFDDQTETCGLKGITGGLNMIQADYNNDGFVDVLVLRGAWLKNAGRHPNSLLHNNGDGSFTDVTEKAGLLSYHPTQTAVWFDYNLDGNPDLFIGNEYGIEQIHPCELFHNNGDGTFSNRAAELGLEVRAYVKGVTSSDFDNDGRPDLYISCLGTRNLLFKNNGPDYMQHGKRNYFSEVGRAAGVKNPTHSFPTWFFDYNNDGNMDLFVVGYRIKGVGDFVNDYRGLPHQATFSKLYRNLGNGNFEDVTEESGLNTILLGMGLNFGDLDNDGYPDFYISTGDPDLMTLIPNRMFRNNAGKGFQEITESARVGHLQKGHAIAFADLDQDGDQDVYAVMGGAVSGDIYQNALFQNPGHGRPWLKLKLEGRISNRSAIGARVRVVTQTANASQTFHGQVSSGGSFGANPLLIEMGLGEAVSIKKVEIRWPGIQATQILDNLDLNQFYHVIEGENNPKTVVLKPFVIKHSSSHMQM